MSSDRLISRLWAVILGICAYAVNTEISNAGQFTTNEGHPIRNETFSVAQ